MNVIRYKSKAGNLGDHMTSSTQSFEAKSRTSTQFFPEKAGTRGGSDYVLSLFASCIIIFFGNLPINRRANFASGYCPSPTLRKLGEAYTVERVGHVNDFQNCHYCLSNDLAEICQLDGDSVKNLLRISL